MKINYLLKNILLGILILIILTILSFNLGFFARFGYYIFLFYFLLTFGVTGYFIKRTNNFLKGQEGEWAVDKILKKLSSDYKYYENGIDTDHGNIDKLVVGPTGIWTVEIKNDFPNSFYLNKHINQAYSQKKYVDELISQKLGLKLPVFPLLVFVNDKYKPIKNLDKGVQIVKKEELITIITNSKEYVLSEEAQTKLNDLLTSI